MAGRLDIKHQPVFTAIETHSHYTISGLSSTEQFIFGSALSHVVSPFSLYLYQMDPKRYFMICSETLSCLSTMIASTVSGHVVFNKTAEEGFPVPYRGLVLFMDHMFNKCVTPKLQIHQHSFLT